MPTYSQEALLETIFRSKGTLVMVYGIHTVIND